MKKKRIKCDPIVEKMGELLKAWRLKENLSQVQAAEFFDVNQSVVSKMESGKVMVGIDIWFRIASRTGIAFDAPFEDVGSATKENNLNRLEKIRKRG
jgi:transcriptional regulator with XRE-family HTH domain